MEIRNIAERVGVGSSPFVLPDGDLCVPVEIRSPGGPQGQAVVVSADHGRTISARQDVAVDGAAGQSYSDGRYIRLFDGSYLMHAWAYDYATQETLPVHQSRSADGRTWAGPEPTTIRGQISSPLELSPGFIIAVANSRMPPEGNQLWWSHDSGATWSDQPIQMWDVASARVAGHPVAGGASAGLPF